MRYLVILLVLVSLTGCLTKQDCMDQYIIVQGKIAECRYKLDDHYRLKLQNYDAVNACDKQVDIEMSKLDQICEKTGGAF